MATQPRKGGQASSQGAPGPGAKTEGCSQGVSGEPCESHHGDTDRARGQRATATRSTTMRTGRGLGRVLPQLAQAKSPGDQATSPFRSCTNTCTCVPSLPSKPLSCSWKQAGMEPGQLLWQVLEQGQAQVWLPRPILPLSTLKAGSGAALTVHLLFRPQIVLSPSDPLSCRPGNACCQHRPLPGSSGQPGARVLRKPPPQALDSP